MYDLAEEKQSDIVLGSIERMHENFDLQEKASKKHTIILDGDQGLIELMNHKSIRGHVWGNSLKIKKIRRSNFHQIFVTPKIYFSVLIYLLVVIQYALAASHVTFIVNMNRALYTKNLKDFYMSIGLRVLS